MQEILGQNWINIPCIIYVWIDLLNRGPGDGRHLLEHLQHLMSFNKCDQIKAYFLQILYKSHQIWSQKSYLNWPAQPGVGRWWPPPRTSGRSRLLPLRLDLRLAWDAVYGRPMPLSKWNPIEQWCQTACQRYCNQMFRRRWNSLINWNAYLHQLITVL